MSKAKADLSSDERPAKRARSVSDADYAWSMIMMGEMLVRLSQNGELEGVKKLLKENPDLDVNYGNTTDCPDEDMSPPALIQAVKHSQSEVVDFLLSLKATEPNVVAGEGYSPLCYALMTLSPSNDASRRILHSLLRDRRVRPQTKGWAGRDAIWALATSGDLEAARMLIALKGDDVHLLQEVEEDDYDYVALSRQSGGEDVAVLLEDFIRDPKGTRACVRAELKIEE
jgi:hypothetical protein